MIQAIELRACATAREFVDTLHRSNDYWWTGGSCPWVFRGHFDGDNWHLLPTVFRSDPSNRLEALIRAVKEWAEPFKERFVAKMPSNRGLAERCWTALIQANAESQALHEFAKLANELGFPVHPVPLSPFEQGELLALDDPNISMRDDAFPQRGYREPDSFSPQLHIAPTAQHHRVPTRLLDFTVDPLAAAYFAVAKSFRPDNCRPETTAVFALNTKAPNYRVYRNCRFQLIDHSHLTFPDEYVRAQSGCFIRIRDAGQYFVNYGEWPALDHILADSTIGSALPILRKIAVPTSEVDKVLEILERERLHLARIMPSLDNVADTIVRAWGNSSFTAQLPPPKAE